MKGIDYWRFSRELEIYQAVFLILGLDPSDDRDSRYGMDFSVDGYQAMKQVLNQAIERDIIIANEGLLEVDSIKKWLKQEEFYPDFFFPKENTAHETAENLEDEWVCSLPPKPETPDYLNSQHSYYAPKLATFAISSMPLALVFPFSLINPKSAAFFSSQCSKACLGVFPLMPLYCRQRLAKL